MNEACYLCGKQIAADASDDHVVPKQFVKRAQPKVKGFDYGGILPSHAECNNEFGAERVSQKALALIRVLHDENCFRSLLRCFYSWPRSGRVNRAMALVMQLGRTRFIVSVSSLTATVSRVSSGINHSVGVSRSSF